MHYTYVLQSEKDSRLYTGSTNDLKRRLVEAWGRGIPLILEKEPGVEFREVAKLFITSFARPSFKKIASERETATKEKGLNRLSAKSLILLVGVEGIEPSTN